jgi:hypothetical protein
MASQILTAIVLPAGLAASGALQANIYLAPRLSGATDLSSFPDWLAWPELVSQHGLAFELQCGSSVATVPAEPGALRPDIWGAIFTSATLVQPYPQPGYSQRLFVSYPVADALSYLKYAYLSAATEQEPSVELFLRFLRYLVFRNGRESTLDAVLSALRVTMWQQQHPTFAIGEPEAVAPSATTAPPPAAADATTISLLSPPTDALTMAQQFALYHHLPPAPGRPPLPASAADFSSLLDFHTALSSLSAHPALLSALGLVFPVELPAGFCPPSPVAGSYLTVSVTSVDPGWQWSVPPTFGTVPTAYARSSTAYSAAPATDPASLAAGTLAAGDVIDGFLALPPDAYQLTDVDIDGALLKAMTLADNLAYVGDQSVVQLVLPSLRSAGISLIASGRAEQLLTQIESNEAFEEALAGGTSPRPLNARDLVRGYRLDVWASRASKWLSLHRRDGTYRFGEHGAVSMPVTDQEGFTQLAVAQPADDPTRPVDGVAASAGIPQPGTDLYVNERIARWNGWSLSAPRPGTPVNRSPDPSVAADPDPTMGEPATPFKMTTDFAAHPGSLPELRFGERYRLRARVVDIAGHSPDLATPAPSPFVAPPAGGTMPYLRYDPVSAPVLIERATPGPGGSHAQLVIRSYNSDPSLDNVATQETDERHVAPPKASVLLVEHHGMLDDASGHLRGDAATYSLVVERDRGQFPTVDDVPIVSAEQITIPYFPDPLSRGAALAGLPHAPVDTDGVISGGVLSYQPSADVVPLTGTVTMVSFGSGWPDLQAFRIRLAESTGVPAWDDPSRVLTVPVAKAETATVGLSCYLDPADLELLGVWAWIRELFESSQANALQSSSAGSELVELADQLSQLTRLVLAGGDEMITPQLQVSFVHAVQQPLGRPAWRLLPVVHNPESPLAVPSIENSFWKITAWRYVGSHTAVLLGALQIDGASSAAIDIDATWTEWVDDPSAPGPTASAAAAPVERIQLGSLSDGPIYSDGSETRMVAVYLSEVDTLWFAASFDALPGVETPADVAAPVHHFADTRHRCINYQATASSRFQEYFTEPGLSFTRTSDPIMVDVPSSARPTAPEVLYVLPTFGWERQESTNLKTEVRFGNGLRVYLSRPWFSSGEGELLGVVLWPGTEAPPDDAQREASKEIITQWGLDPIWNTATIGAVPGTGNLTGAEMSAQALTIEESSQLVDVAGHAVGYDPGRQLWYCDIEFGGVESYMPFVRLALARYQPSSIAGVELSHVVLADYAQLTPDRSAALLLDPATPNQARLVVGGLAPAGPAISYVTVTVQARMNGVSSDLGWTTAAAASVSVAEDAPAPGEPASLLWSGTVTFATTPAPGEFRVVVQESEQIATAIATDGTPTYGSRLVYASILPFDFFPPTPE